MTSNNALRTMWTAVAVDLSRLQGPALTRHLRMVAEYTAAEQYGCEVVGDEVERTTRDFWTVPGDLEGQRVVCSRWDVRRLPPASKQHRVASWMNGTVIIGGDEVPE